MTFEKQSKREQSKREQSKNNKKKEEMNKKKKRDEDSDSDNSNFSETDDSETEEMDVIEYRKLLAKLFPSKYADKKVKAGNKLKKIVEEEEEEEEYETDSTFEEPKKSKKSKKTIVSKKHSKKKVVKDDEEDEEEQDEQEEEHVKKDKKNEKVNIIFTIGDLEEDEYDEFEDEEWESISEYETENEDDPISDVSSVEEEEEEEKDKEISKIKTRSKSKKETEKTENNVEDDKKEDNKIKEDKKVKVESYNENDDKELLNQLLELKDKNKENKAIENCIQFCKENIKKKEKKMEKKEQKYKDRNSRIFKKILKDKNVNNDYDFFQELDIENQKKMIKELKEINKLTRIEKPYRISLLETSIPTLFKGAAMKKINSLRYMEQGSGEYYKIKNWVDNFMRIPFDNFQKLPINISDGVEKCHEFMEKSQKILDDAVYGLNDAKMQIMQMLGQLVTNPNALGCAIAIQGPAGTGKTSIVKEGISKILNRPFAFIALGGATDSSFLEGHSYTYEGSTWGKIVQILIDSKCMNPVIYFDELDKISDTPKGEEITGILTHLTDTSQNTQFHDKYFAELDFDLSKCLFIFSYNDESKINPILKDRMYRIHTKGYNLKQKTIISNNYLLPKIREQVLFSSEDIIIPDESLHYIIDNFCSKEEGVRNLKRCLEIIYTKINLYRLMKPGSNLFEQEMSIKVEFPFEVTRSVVDKLIKIGKDENMSYRALYI
jgi:ATP-dependent Lon protease